MFTLWIVGRSSFHFIWLYCFWFAMGLAASLVYCCTNKGVSSEYIWYISPHLLHILSPQLPHLLTPYPPPLCFFHHWLPHQPFCFKVSCTTISFVWWWPPLHCVTSPPDPDMMTTVVTSLFHCFLPTRLEDNHHQYFCIVLPPHPTLPWFNPCCYFCIMLSSPCDTSQWPPLLALCDILSSPHSILPWCNHCHCFHTAFHNIPHCCFHIVLCCLPTQSCPDIITTFASVLHHYFPARLCNNHWHCLHFTYFHLATQSLHSNHHFCHFCIVLTLRNTQEWVIGSL